MDVLEIWLILEKVSKHVIIYDKTSHQIPCFEFKIVARIQVIFFLCSFFQERVSRLWLLWHKQFLVPRSCRQTVNEIFFTVHMISYFTRKTFVFVSIIPLNVKHKLLLSWRVWVSSSADITRRSSNKKEFLDSYKKIPIMWPMICLCGKLIFWATTIVLATNWQ